jgi:hypothetical protein
VADRSRPSLPSCGRSHDGEETEGAGAGGRPRVGELAASLLHFAEPSGLSSEGLQEITRIPVGSYTCECGWARVVEGISDTSEPVAYGGRQVDGYIQR